MNQEQNDKKKVNKMTFVKQDLVIDESINEPVVEEEKKHVPLQDTLSAEERQKRKRKEKIRKAALVFVFAVISNSLLVLFGLVWQNDFATLMAWGDSLWFAFALQFAVAWILTVYNMNLFSPLIHGTKTFLLLFVGKKPKEDYYTFMMKVQNNQIPKFYIVAAYFCALMVLIPAIITLIILMT